MRLRLSGVLQLVLGVGPAGCAERVELPEVPIVGGSPEQRQQAREALLAFDAWVGPGRVRLTEVRFGSYKPSKGWNGRFREARDQILIDDGYDPASVRRVMRHELCHALDYGEGLLRDPQPAFDEVGQFVRPGIRSLRGRRGEALAKACEIGPFGPHVLSFPCDGEPELAGELSRWLSRHVWRGFEPFPPVPRDQEDALVVTACCFDDIDWIGFDVLPTTSPDWIFLTLIERDGGPLFSYQRSLYSGDARVGGTEVAESTLEPPYPEGATEIRGVAVSSGLGAAYARYALPFLRPDTNDDIPERLILTDGNGWALADPACRSQHRSEDVFAADDRLWFAWDDGGSVRWREIR